MKTNGNGHMSRISKKMKRLESSRENNYIHTHTHIMPDRAKKNDSVSQQSNRATDSEFILLVNVCECSSSSSSGVGMAKLSAC